MGLLNTDQSLNPSHEKKLLPFSFKGGLTMKLEERSSYFSSFIDGWIRPRDCQFHFLFFVEWVSFSVYKRVRLVMRMIYNGAEDKRGNTTAQARTNVRNSSVFFSFSTPWQISILNGVNCYSSPVLPLPVNWPSLSKCQACNPNTTTNGFERRVSNYLDCPAVTGDTTVMSSSPVSDKSSSHSQLGRGQTA